MNAIVPVAASTITLRHYEALREAASLCATVDEATEIRDRMAALSLYARQRDDTEVLVWLQEIRLRAGRRIGEILRDIEREKGGRPGPGTRLRAEPSLITRAITGAKLRRAPAYELQEIAGPKDARLRAIADGAAESYYAQARATCVPATQAGLKRVVITALHAALGPDEIRRAAKNLRRDTQKLKAVRRAERELALAEATRAATDRLGTQVYAIVYADPPWPDDEVWSEETGMDRAAANHYPVMALDEIQAMPIPAAPDAALFLWVTNPHLAHGIDLLRGWGFAYKSSWVWRKNRIGLGRWNRNCHEQLLVGTRGDVPAPLPGTQLESVIDAALGAHSEKPLRFAEMIQGFYPASPKIELFARAPRPGWDVWGNEAAGGAA